MILPLFGQPKLPGIPITRRILDMGKLQRQPMRPKDLAERIEPILEAARKDMEPFQVLGTLHMLLELETDLVRRMIMPNEEGPTSPQLPEIKP
jgi:hypothetical protein